MPDIELNPDVEVTISISQQDSTLMVVEPDAEVGISVVGQRSIVIEPESIVQVTMLDRSGLLKGVKGDKGDTGDGAVTLGPECDHALVLEGQELTLTLPDYHDPITIAAGSDAALTLDAQELTLANVLTPTEHTNIGDASPHHASVTISTT